MQYTKKGVTYNDFGLIAHLVLAGYINASVIEGSEIYGGLLQSTNYSAQKTGTHINLNKGTFEFNANNEPKLTLDENGVLTVKGTIKAERGWIGGQNAFVIEDGKIYCQKNSITSSANGVYIGTDGIALGANNVLKLTNDGTFYAERGYLGGTNGFVLEQHKLYSGKSSISDAANGIYLGTDGIALGANSAFQVTPYGDLTAKSGTIGGARISNNSIRSENNKWWINSDGRASFEDVHISNVRSGSSFGGVTYDHTGTYGGFGNGFWADNRFGLSGGALTNFNDLVVENITAENIKKTNVLDDYATNASLNAINKKIQSLDESKINISDLTWKSITYVSELKTRPVYVITAADGSKGESVRVVSEHTSSILYTVCGKGI